MSRIKASLIFDPDRRAEQMAYARERVSEWHEVGSQVWTSVTEDQAARFAEQGIYVQLREGAELIQLPAVVFDPSEAVPEPPSELAASEPTGEATAYYLVQFLAPPERLWISFIEELGATFVQDAPAQASVFRMTAALAAQTAGAREQACVAWVGLYHPAYALSYDLAGRNEPFTAADLSTMRVEPATGASGEGNLLEVVFFPDRTTAEMRPAVEAAGATVRGDTGYSLIIALPMERMTNLLRIAGVFAVGRRIQPQPGNQRAGIIIAANQVRNFGNVDFLVNLDGSGEIVGVLDTGLDNGAIAGLHTDFNDAAGGSRVIFLANLNSPPLPAPPIPSTDLWPHGTHVAGTIVGDGRNSLPLAPPNTTVPRGIAPAARIVFHSANLNPPPALNYNFLASFRDAYDKGARVHNNSTWSAGTNSYDNVVSQPIDLFAFLRQDLTIIFIAGNGERDLNANSRLDSNTLGNTAVAKNILCVGACESDTSTDGDARNYSAAWPGPFSHPAANAAAPFSMSNSANDLAMFSNRGRVKLSNRVRPDVVAPGTNIISVGPRAMLPFPAGNSFRPTTAPPAFYYVQSGTSMAAPMVAGGALLTRQFYRRRFSRLRRPLPIEALANAVPPLTFVDLPACAAHSAGAILAWVRPTAAAGPNHIVAARFDRRLRRIGSVVQLQANVGAHPAMALARRGETTLLVHRNGADLRLSLYDNLLAPVAGFGAGGMVNVANNSAADDDRRPALCARETEVAVAWVQSGDTLLFRRFDATTGAAVDAAAINLGAATNTSPHQYLTHNGARYATVWIRLSGGNHQLLMRFVENNGALQPAQPVVLLTQPQPIREAHLIWDSRQNRYLVTWIGEDAAGKHVFALRVRADGTAAASPQAIVDVTAAQAVRRPRVALHPDSGYVLFWEDNTQGTHDLYLTFLNILANLDRPINDSRMQISDTPNDISGFSALVDSDGILPLWQSNDEVNSDALGVYALNVTRGGAFQAQADPNTPLLQNGHYVSHLLLEHDSVDLSHIALAWAGGDYYHFRSEPNGLAANAQLVHTNADGLPDVNFGAGGARRIDFEFGYYSFCLRYRDARLIAAYSGALLTRVFLFDATGNPIAGFGTKGVVTLSEIAAEGISVQVAKQGTGGNSRIFVAYSLRNDPGPHRIRYTVMTESGATTGAGTVAPRDLVAQASGTAKQGWFHLVSSDAPVHLIAAWHVKVGAAMQAQLNRFKLTGAPQSGVAGPIQLTTLAGDSQNAVIAPRPILFDPVFPLPATAATDSLRREYGVAWQYRPAAAAPWEIRFSRLNRNGTVLPSTPNPGGVPNPLPTADVPVFADAATHGLEPQLIWHTNGYGLAWLKQPVAGGDRQLFFTILDQNGRRVNLAQTLPGAPPPAALLAPDILISSAGADVQAFQLVWNGRTFRVAWTEVVGGKVRHQQRAIAVPRLQGETRYDEPFGQPSSALIRATLINGATNIRNTALPNFGNDPNDGYGWGRINLRQSLAPIPPVTFHVRDDGAVGSGQTARYVFELLPETRLLRITLAWTDPPGNQIVNHLHLRVTSPAAGATPSRVYVGNRWQTGVATANSGPPFSAPLPAKLPPNPFENIHTVEQIVIPDPPAGPYRVEVIAEAFPTGTPFMQLPGQPFALVFVGSGPEIRTGALAPAGPLPFF
ncbi:MAG TPA: S8 family serine peptidase [Blastocatellia bacterium]|nr:S8 family serine peptidase [Blastocatellia bacterium]